MLINDGILIALVSAVVFMTANYILAQLKRDTSIVDVAWGLGFFVVALSLSIQLDGQNDIFSLVHLLVVLWSVTLFMHILLRRAGKDEDWRYANWRTQWGRTHWWRSFLQVFILQAVLMTVIAAPLYVSWAAEDTSIQWVSIVGAAVWLLGFYFESVGDYQLTKFIQDKNLNRAKKGRKKSKKKQPEFLTTGLWRLTRHPNYFGEVTQWWGLWIIVLPTSYGLAAIVSPITITALLLWVSGVPMLEKKWADNKEFLKYKQKTNAFFPGKPKGR